VQTPRGSQRRKSDGTKQVRAFYMFFSTEEMTWELVGQDIFLTDDRARLSGLSVLNFISQYHDQLIVEALRDEDLRTQLFVAPPNDLLDTRFDKISWLPKRFRSAMTKSAKANFGREFETIRDFVQVVKTRKAFLRMKNVGERSLKSLDRLEKEYGFHMPEE